MYLLTCFYAFLRRVVVPVGDRVVYAFKSVFFLLLQIREEGTNVMLIRMISPFLMVCWQDRFRYRPVRCAGSDYRGIVRLGGDQEAMDIACT